MKKNIDVHRSSYLRVRGLFLFSNKFEGAIIMNTTGMIRGYMSKNMKAEEFIKIVVTALSKEFSSNVELEGINDNKFKITMKNYEVVMSGAKSSRRIINQFYLK